MGEKCCKTVITREKSTIYNARPFFTRNILAFNHIRDFSLALRAR
jgi:hypothetical protein